MSQADLAFEAGISIKHLSYVETGKAFASREILLQLAAALDLSLRDRNALLEAGGFARQYRERDRRRLSLRRQTRSTCCCGGMSPFPPSSPTGNGTSSRSMSGDRSDGHDARRGAYEASLNHMKMFRADEYVRSWRIGRRRHGAGPASRGAGRRRFAPQATRRELLRLPDIFRQLNEPNAGSAMRRLRAGEVGTGLIGAVLTLGTRR